MAIRGEGERTSAAPPFPARRVVLLGASNLAIGLPTVIAEAKTAWGAPLDFLAALGHGRSYGMESRVFARSLPGILTCGLWEALAQRSLADTAALVTDVGNDLLYGATPEQIAMWVEQCVLRLRGISAATVVTELPLASLGRLGFFRFLLMRTLFFPTSQLAYDEAVKQARELNRRVQEIVPPNEAHLVTPRASWYGFDPIHIRSRDRRIAWREILACWNRAGQAATPGLSPRDRFALRCLRPERRCLFGIEQRQAQPVRTLSDGTLVSLY